MRKADYLALGGFDEQFQSPGGGLTNLDFFQRALANPELSYVVVLGEATFHQVHGGVATNALPHEHPWNIFHREYLRIRGHPFVRVPREPRFLGNLPEEAASIAELSRSVGARIWQASAAAHASADRTPSDKNRFRATG
jgi:hypothetical protein